jgi:hypothetical protein
MTGRFEWHITVDKSYSVEVRKLAEISGAVFSQITGCPILGQGEYCYLTGYDTESDDVRIAIDFHTAHLRMLGVPVLRAKIENIVYDTKTGVDTLSERA